MAGDHTAAVALMIAKEKLEADGWKYTSEDIGFTARKILDGLESAQPN